MAESYELDEGAPSFTEGSEIAEIIETPKEEPSKNYNFYNESDLIEDKKPGWFERPLLETLWKTGIAARNKSENLIAKAGSKLDETGYLQRAGYYVVKATDKTVRFGETIAN